MFYNRNGNMIGRNFLQKNEYTSFIPENSIIEVRLLPFSVSIGEFMFDEDDIQDIETNDEDYINDDEKIIFRIIITKQIC